MKQRPVFLDVLKIRMPLPAVVSIGHRISGIVIALALPLLLYLLACITHPGIYLSYICQGLFANNWMKCLLWIIFSALAYHVLAGVKHLLSDFFHLGHTLAGAMRASLMMLVLFGGVSILLGMRLWGWI